MKILITSGGTKVPIDSVRSITNMSSGRFGASLAEYMSWTVIPHSPIFAHDVFLFRARDSFKIESSEHCYEDTFVTYDEYRDKLVKNINNFNPDIVISAAAVSDYGVKPVDGKISSNGEVTLTLYPIPKVLPLIKQAKPDVKLVGFKLLVSATKDELISAARKQIETAGSDLVAANDLNDIRAGNRKYLMVNKNGDITEIGGESLYSDFVKLVINLK